MSETTNEPNVIPAASCVLISGGSRGLGLAFVEEVLANGAKVAAFARTVTPELQQLMDANPERVYVGSVDITDSKAVTSFIKDAAKVLGPIDALVNNAAIGQDSLHLHTTPERIEAMLGRTLAKTGRRGDMDRATASRWARPWPTARPCRSRPSTGPNCPPTPTTCAMSAASGAPTAIPPRAWRSA